MLPHFHTLYLETTRACNLNCQYCSTGSNGSFKKEADLTIDQIVNRILVPAREIGTKNVSFSGGEFLLRMDALQLVAIANEMEFSISIVSNGSTLNRLKIKELQYILGDNLQISLGVNSFTSENKATRDKTSDFTMKKIQLLQEHGVNINLSVAIGQYNIESFMETVNKIRDLGLPFNRIPFVVRNCLNKELMYDAESMKRYFHPPLRNCFNGGVSYTPFFLSPEEYTRASGQTEKYDRIPTNPSIGCWCGSFYAINPEGDVSICPLLLDHVSGGNIIKDNLEDILTESAVFKRVLKRETLGGDCGKCQYRFTCGGCRAMAYYKTNDLFGEDPTCFLKNATDKEQSDMETETLKSFQNYVRMASVGASYTIPDK